MADEWIEAMLLGGTTDRAELRRRIDVQDGRKGGRFMTHYLKTWPEHFDAVLAGDKTVELRVEDNRHYDVGDVLVLQEWDRDRVDVAYWDHAHVSLRERRELEKAGYTGRAVRRVVSHVLRDPCWLQPGVAALSIRPARTTEAPNEE